MTPTSTLSPSSDSALYFQLLTSLRLQRIKVLFFLVELFFSIRFGPPFIPPQPSPGLFSDTFWFPFLSHFHLRGKACGPRLVPCKSVMNSCFAFRHSPRLASAHLDRALSSLMTFGLLSKHKIYLAYIFNLFSGCSIFLSPVGPLRADSSLDLDM